MHLEFCVRIWVLIETNGHLEGGMWKSRAVHKITEKLILKGYR